MHGGLPCVSVPHTLSRIVWLQLHCHGTTGSMDEKKEKNAEKCTIVLHSLHFRPIRFIPLSLVSILSCPQQEVKLL